MLLVGYDSGSEGTYWIVKNSWGETWGQNGYVLVKRSPIGDCGIERDSSYPVVDCDDT